LNPPSTLHWVVATSHLGQVLAAFTPAGLAALLLGDPSDDLLADLQSRYPRAALLPGDDAHITQLARLIAHFDSPATVPAPDLPLQPHGTAFQRQVWTALQSIPRGTTTTYTALAARIGSPRAVRAVATACAANPIAILIPCHRVIRTDGTLAGYRWGLLKKQTLLTQEQSHSSPQPKPLSHLPSPLAQRAPTHH
jgi:AraC family transcriptional regulator of adaptative response/methylated-DNA-[protein]-cysteine methyltransferase